MSGNYSHFRLLTVLTIALVVLQTVSCNECVNNTRLSNGCNTLGLFEAYKTQLTPACDEHDICYYCGFASKVTRASCDEAFYRHMLRICDGHVGCEWNALLYFYMTSMFGEPYYIRDSLQICKKNCVNSILRDIKSES